ncbi:thiamine-phosphate diphosphorylase [Planococcus lenghuensis]|uniref:Thiamine-phosphate synthase n=2 Tax=Planococcus lenghuensis TaxID=2213202 RepID=A0A1Q2L3Q2_9BACL|nr:thiamine-phosphate diphosphorylase [Planococcus lenghuensis]
MGTTNAVGRDPLVILEEALIGGISHFQLREKGTAALTGKELKTFALACQKLCRRHRVPFIINDDVELACAIDADGVHVGQEDLDCASVQSRIGKDKILGVSVHSVEEAKRAVADGADYVGMGPVYGTRSKDDAKPPAGIVGIVAVKKAFPALSIVGIGGIKPENASAVYQAGAESVAVISSLAGAEDVRGQVNLFKEAYKGAPQL